MKNKQIEITFTPQSIKWAQGVTRKRELSIADHSTMEVIYKTFDPSYRINCSSCHQAIATDFHRLVGIMEKQIGCKLMSWSPPTTPEKKENNSLQELYDLFDSTIQQTPNELLESEEMEFLVSKDYGVTEYKGYPVRVIDNLDDDYAIFQPIKKEAPKWREEHLDGLSKKQVAAFVKKETKKDLGDPKKFNLTTIKEAALKILNFGE